MAISERTRKLLWSRSGNRCAYCGCKLVIEASENDGEAVVGEECHIVSRSSNGPRGSSSATKEERDEYENLLLLCARHHKLIDNQPNTFTVKILKNLKSAHEKRIDEAISQAVPEITFESAFAVVSEVLDAGDVFNGIRKLNAISEDIAQKYHYPRHTINLLLNSLVCRQPVIIGAYPGQGVSHLVKYIAKSFEMSVFSSIILEDTTPEELGISGQRLHISADGSLTTIRKPTLSAQLGFFDEANRINSRLLKKLIDMLESEEELIGLIFRANTYNLESADPSVNFLTRKVGVKVFLDLHVGDRVSAVMLRSLADGPRQINLSTPSISIAEQRILVDEMKNVSLEQILPKAHAFAAASITNGISVPETHLAQMTNLIALSALRRHSHCAAVEDLWCLPYLAESQDKQSTLQRILGLVI